jgi:hypothetical protein
MPTAFLQAFLQTSIFDDGGTAMTGFPKDIDSSSEQIAVYRYAI